MFRDMNYIFADRSEFNEEFVARRRRRRKVTNFLDDYSLTKMMGQRSRDVRCIQIALDYAVSELNVTCLRCFLFLTKTSEELVSEISALYATKQPGDTCFHMICIIMIRRL